MLLTVHNLPSHYRYSDVKALLLQKCGLSELILDNLISEGSTKKVTVGVADDGDAAVLARKVNGLYVDGQQLYVEDSRKKRLGSEQPFRSNKKSSQMQNAHHTQAQYHDTQSTMMPAQYHDIQATIMPSQTQLQYVDPQAYVAQNAMLQTNTPVMQAPYANSQAPMMQGYGMAAGMYMAPQDTSMLGYQADSQPYKPVGLTDPSARQANWGEQNTNDWGKAAEEYRNWNDNQQGNWDQSRPNDDQWVRQRSRSRSPPRVRSRHDNRSNRDQSRPTWEPRQDWYPQNRDSNADTAYRRPASPRRDRYNSQRREPSQKRGEGFHGNPGYTSQYEPGRNAGRNDLPQRYEPEDNQFQPAYQTRNELPYGEHVRERNRSRSPRGRRFEGSSRQFHEREERGPWPDRKRPADREDHFVKKSRWGVQFDNQGQRPTGQVTYPLDKNKPGARIAPDDYIPMRDRTWRKQAVAGIAKANASGEVARTITYYKRAVTSRLDKMMGKEIGVPPADMIVRYQHRYNDTKVLFACKKSAEEDEKGQIAQGAASASAATTNLKAASVAKPKPKPTATTSEQPVAKPQKPKKKTANIVVPGRLPNYPAGDKQIFKDAKKALKMEFEGEMTYSLDAPEDQALESDLDNLTMLIKDECDATGEDATPAEKYIAEKADTIADELRTDGETEGIQPSLASQQQPLQSLARQQQLFERLANLPPLLESPANQQQPSESLGNQPKSSDRRSSEMMENELPDELNLIKKNRKRRRRTGVPRNGGRMTEWGRLPKYKRRSVIAEKINQDYKQQAQSEKTEETHQDNRTALDQNMRKNENTAQEVRFKAVEQDRTKVNGDKVTERGSLPSEQRLKKVMNSEEDNNIHRTGVVTKPDVNVVKEIEVNEKDCNEVQDVKSEPSSSSEYDEEEDSDDDYDKLELSEILTRQALPIYSTIERTKLKETILSSYQTEFQSGTSDYHLVKEDYLTTIDEVKLETASGSQYYLKDGIPSITSEPQSSESLTKLSDILLHLPVKASFACQTQTADQPLEDLESVAQPSGSLASKLQLSECVPSQLQNDSQTENIPKRKKKKNKRRPKKKKRTGVPRNGGSWKEWGRLPRYKRPSKIAEKMKQENKQQAQSEQTEETHQDNRTGLDQNTRENENTSQEVRFEAVRQDGTIFKQEEDNMAVRTKICDTAVEMINMTTEIEFAPDYHLVKENYRSIIDEVKLETASGSQRYLRDRIPSINSAPQSSESLTKSSDILSHLPVKASLACQTQTADQPLEDLASLLQPSDCSEQRLKKVMNPVEDNIYTTVVLTKPDANVVKEIDVSEKVCNVVQDVKSEPSSSSEYDEEKDNDDNDDKLELSEILTRQALQIYSTVERTKLKETAPSESQTQSLDILSHLPVKASLACQTQTADQSLEDLASLQPSGSLTSETQLSDCVPNKLQNYGQTEMMAKGKKKKNRIRGKKNKRSGVPRNGGSWKEWGRLPSYKRPSAIAEKMKQLNKQQAQSEQTEETHQDNGTDLDQNTRENENTSQEVRFKALGQDKTKVDGDEVTDRGGLPSEQRLKKIMNPEEDNNIHRTEVLTKQDVNVVKEVEVNEKGRNVVQDVKLEPSLFSEYDGKKEKELSEILTRQVLPIYSTVAKTKLKETAPSESQTQSSHNLSHLPVTASLVQPSGSLTNASQLSECVPSQPQLLKFLASQTQLLEFLASEPQLLECLLSKPQLSGTLTSQPQLSGTLTSQPQLSGTLTSQPQLLDSLASQPQLLKSLASQPQLLECLTSIPQLLESLANQSQSLETLKTQPQLLESLANIPNLLETLANQPQLLETLACQPQLLESLASIPKVLKSLSDQPQLLQSLASIPQTLVRLENQPQPSSIVQLLESLERIPQLLENLASKPQNDGRTGEMGIESARAKKRIRPGRKRRGVPKNGGHKTEWGRLPKYKRPKKVINTEEDNDKQITEGEQKQDVNLVKVMEVNEEYLNVVQEVKSEPSSYSQDNSDEEDVSDENDDDDKKQLILPCTPQNADQPVQSLANDGQTEGAEGGPGRKRKRIRPGRKRRGAPKNGGHKREWGRLPKYKRPSYLAQKMPCPEENTNTSTRIELAEVDLLVKQEMLSNIDVAILETASSSRNYQTDCLPSLACEPQLSAELATETHLSIQTDDHLHAILATQPQPEEVTVVKVKFDESDSS